MLSLFKYITRSSTLSIEEIKLFAVVNWIFYVSDFLKFFAMPCKYGLILLKYLSTDSVLLLSSLYSYSIYSLHQKLLNLTGL